VTLDLHRWQTGAGSAVVCLHETGTTGEVWRPLADAIAGQLRTVAYDRRGWGESPAPEPYVGTTVEEHAEDAVRLIAEVDAGPAVLCGAGFGGVVALDLLARHPNLTRGAALIEPPLLAFLPDATEVLSDDVGALRTRIAAEGPSAGVDLYLSGSLRALGPGAERLPANFGAAAAERPFSLFAELGAVPAWRLPLAQLTRLSHPATIVITTSTPELVRRAAEELADRSEAASLRELDSSGLPQLDAARELGELVLELD
jgi:pimeloyl-ACP methyl ester carboxylesterase